MDVGSRPPCAAARLRSGSLTRLCSAAQRHNQPQTTTGRPRDPDKFISGLDPNHGAGRNLNHYSFGLVMNASVNVISIPGRFAVVVVMLISTLSSFATALDDEHELASANTGFAFKLLKQLAKDQPAKNIFISPFGISTVLQMAGNGAGGQTKTEMQQVLGTTGLAQDSKNAAIQHINLFLNANTNNILTIANAIWYQKGIPAKPDFISCNQQFFQATVDALDFTNAHSVDIINSWASEKTHGKITHIADGMIFPPPDLFLANAVYFKGKWEDPFDRGNTKDKAFHLRNGSQKQVSMMQKSRKFTYRQGTGYQAVRLPYEGWSLSMYVFLPDPGSSPEKLVGIMTGDKWESVTRPGFEDRDGTVVLPKFKLEYGVELEKPLKALGMNLAFNPSGAADFLGISSRPVYISAVRQRTIVEVGEEGTEAVAVTGMTVPMSSAPEPTPPPPFKMIVDRPFLFLIADERTGTILFMGIIFEP